MVILALILSLINAVDYGTVTAMAPFHNRFHVQLYAGLVGGFFMILSVCFLLGHLQNRPVSIIRCLSPFAFAIALTLPIAILYGNGVQGVMYYRSMVIHENVTVSQIPLYGSFDAYHTIDGQYDLSSFRRFNA